MQYGGGSQGDTPNKQNQQATYKVTGENEGSNKEEVEGTVLSGALWWLNLKVFCFSAWTF